jgi:hypothetical protein
MTRPTIRKPKLSPEQLITLLFVSIALLMLTVAVVSGSQAVGLYLREVRTTGVVTALTTRVTADGDVFYYPVITFRLPDGARYSAEIAEGGYPSAYAVDQIVTVAYDPERPDHARIASSFSLPPLWILSAITGFLGVAFLLAASLAWWIGGQFP